MLIGARQFHAQVGRNFPCDFTLHRQNVSKLTNILLTPDMVVVLRVVQRDVDHKLIADLFDAARQHGSYIQFAADLLRVLLLALVTKNRTARHYLQTRQLRQAVDQTLGNAVG